jgi:two-component system, NarL family, sensor histidine kinase BarA
MFINDYRVLIVDDNPTFVKTLSVLIRAILGERLKTLDVVGNGFDAIEKAFGEEVYDVIFMDVDMPGMDGLSATRVIKRRLFRETRVVAISFHKDLDTIREMVLSGAELFISKDNLTIDSLEPTFDLKLS